MEWCEGAFVFLKSNTKKNIPTYKNLKFTSSEMEHAGQNKWWTSWLSRQPHLEAAH